MSWQTHDGWMQRATCVRCGVGVIWFALNPHSGLNPYASFFERVATSTDIVWGVVLLVPLWAGRA